MPTSYVGAPVGMPARNLKSLKPPSEEYMEKARRKAAGYTTAHGSGTGTGPGAGDIPILKSTGEIEYVSAGDATSSGTKAVPSGTAEPAPPSFPSQLWLLYNDEKWRLQNAAQKMADEFTAGVHPYAIAEGYPKHSVATYGKYLGDDDGRPHSVGYIVRLAAIYDTVRQAPPSEVFAFTALLRDVTAGIR